MYQSQYLSFMTSKTVNNNPDNSSINSIDQSKLNEIVMKSVNDISGAIVAMPLILGDRLGLYKAMAGSGPMSSEELATKTNTSERYIRVACESGSSRLRYLRPSQ